MVQINKVVKKENIRDGVPRSFEAKYIRSISKKFAFGDMTDGGSTAGTIDFATGALPADVIVLGWKAVTTAGFAGNTSAVIQVGTSGTADLYSAVTNGSVFAAGTVGSVCKTTGTVFNEAAATPRVTITSATDFSSVNAGSTTVTIYYIDLSL